jgi:hypothetical protein
MAIQSPGEYEIIMNNIVMKLGRKLDEQPNNTTVVTVKRTMEESIAWAKGRKKLEARQLKSFSDASDAAGEAFRGDSDLREQLMDALDFLEYRVG